MYILDDDFTRALDFARKLHTEHSQRERKSGADVLSHLLGVAAIVLENGGAKDAVLAALLHDAAEDCGGEATLAAIRHEFNPRVAKIVEECSDSLEITKQDRDNWIVRKSKFLKKIPNLSKSACLVETADKLHNARATYRDAQTMGRVLWESLGRQVEDQVAYLRLCHRALSHRDPSVLNSELGLYVSLLEIYCDPKALDGKISNMKNYDIG